LRDIASGYPPGSQQTSQQSGGGSPFDGENGTISAPSFPRFAQRLGPLRSFSTVSAGKLTLL
jgi:hypothetical protein